MPAIRSGHLITLPNGTLGVEEACSGIRSLQSTLMMACFLGELNHLRWSSRLILLGWGIAFALLTNVLRTVALSTAAARAGLAAVDDWHDTAGLLALGINTLFLFLLTARFAMKEGGSRRPEAGGRKPEDGSRIDGGGRNRLKQGADPELLGTAEPMPRTQGGDAGIYHWGPGFLALGLGLMLPITAWWYARQPVVAAPAKHLALPAGAPGFRAAEIDAKTTVMLQYSEGWSARWNTANGQPVHGFYFAWEAGKVSLGNINPHQPGNCLGSLGIELVKEVDPLVFNAGGRSLTARIMEFDDRGRTLYVLHALSESALPQGGGSGEPVPFDTASRLRDVLEGRRNPGQRLIEIGVWDEPSEAAARAAFAGFLTEWLREGEGRE